MRLALIALLAAFAASAGTREDDMRQPWQRSDENFIRQWLVVGPFKCTMDAECVSAEGSQRPTENLEQKSTAGTRNDRISRLTAVFGLRSETMTVSPNSTMLPPICVAA